MNHNDSQADKMSLSATVKTVSAIVLLMISIDRTCSILTSQIKYQPRQLFRDNLQRLQRRFVSQYLSFISNWSHKNWERNQLQAFGITLSYRDLSLHQVLELAVCKTEDAVKDEDEDMNRQATSTIKLYKRYRYSMLFRSRRVINFVILCLTQTVVFKSIATAFT